MSFDPLSRDPRFAEPVPLRKRLAGKLLLSVGVFVWMLFLAEAVMRFTVEVEYRPLYKKQWGVLLHRESPVPGLRYELAPDSQIIHWDLPVITNAHGMRDDPPIENPPDTLRRIVALGDSVTFGFGVQQRQAYPNVLEDILNGGELLPGCEFEVLNFGVSGYSTRDEALVFEHKAISMRPDSLLIGYHMNDPEDEAVQPLQLHFEGPAWWQYSHLLRAVAGWLHERDERRLGDGDYFKYLHAPEGRKWKGVLESFDRIRSLAKRRDGTPLPVLVVIFPFFDGYADWEDYPYTAQHAQVAEACEARGWEVLDAYELFKDSGLTRWDLRLDRGHPKPEGHRLVAVELRRRLEATYPCLAARR